MGVLHVPYGSTHYLTGQNRSSGQFFMGHITCEEESGVTIPSVKYQELEGRQRQKWLRKSKGQVCRGWGFLSLFALLSNPY